MTQTSSDGGIEVRPSTREDLPALGKFITQFVEQNRLLPRTKDELNELIPLGFIACRKDELIGFAALEIYSSKLAEIRSLAVDPEMQGKGLGKRLVHECIELARQRNVLEVMAITSTDEFFLSCGFDFTLPGEKKALFIQTRDEA